MNSKVGDYVFYSDGSLALVKVVTEPTHLVDGMSNVQLQFLAGPMLTDIIYQGVLKRGTLWLCSGGSIRPASPLSVLQWRNSNV